jgi:DnaJ like chaperone protein
MRWIGAIVGYFFLEWQGVFLGFLVGSVLDFIISFIRKLIYGTSDGEQQASEHPIHHLFTLSMVVLKAGGKATPAAIEYIEGSFRESFGPDAGQFLTDRLHTSDKREKLEIIQRIISKEISLEPPCNALRAAASAEELANTLRFLFGVARANGQSPRARAEVPTLARIATLLGLNDYTFNSIRDECLANDSDTSPENLKIAMHHLFTLAMAVLKAGGRATPAAVAYIESSFREAFGANAEQFLTDRLRTSDKRERIEIIQRLITREIPLETPGNALREATLPGRIDDTLRFLFGVARANGRLSRGSGEVPTLARIATLLGINVAAFNTIRDEFIANNNDSGNPFSRWRTRDSSSPDAYALLGIPDDATDDEVKKAYRLAAKKFHPDKFTHKGEAAIAAANKKFIAINDAYEKIKQARGL